MTANSTQKNVLEINRLGFYYDTRQEQHVVSEFSLRIAQGEILAISGRSGSGKSTLLRIIAGLLRETAGEILMNGSSFSARLGKVGLMPQQDMLLPWLRVVDNTALPLRIKGCSRNEAREKSLALLRDFDLYNYKDAYPHQLSGGMRQRISLMRTSICGNSVLLLDEPFSKLDYFTRYECIVWAKEVAKHLNALIIYVSHDIDEALSFATRIVVVNTPGMQILLDTQNNGRKKPELRKKILSALSLISK